MTQTKPTFFRPRRLGHANLFVGDYERASDYYRDIVGFHEVYRQPDSKASFVSNGNTYHDLGLTDIHSKYAPPGQTTGLFHYAFEVETEVDLVEGYRSALEAGVKFRSTEDHDVAHSLYLYDPDGLMVEVYADVIADWRTHRRGIVVKEKPKYVPGVTSEPNPHHNYPKNPPIEVVEHSVFHSKKASHVGVVAEHFEEMVEFYTRVIGLQLFAGSSDGQYAVLEGTHGGALTLYRKTRDLQLGFHHVGFEVWDEKDLDRALAALDTTRTRIERTVDSPARRAMTIIDPDGIRLQFYVNRQWTPETAGATSAADAPYLL
jgi:catechol 2,3-dioxygenase